MEFWGSGKDFRAGGCDIIAADGFDAWGLDKDLSRI
jgi:hypothetical protein